MQFIASYQMGEYFSLHGFVKNLDEKFGRIALNKDYGHYLRAILCLFRPDFPQNPCSTDFLGLMNTAGNGLIAMDVIHAFGCELAELGPCNFFYAVGSRVYVFASRRRYPDGEREPGLWRLSRKCREAETDIAAPGIQFWPGTAVDQQIILCASIPITEEDWQSFSVNELICISKGQLIDQRY